MTEARCRAPRAKKLGHPGKQIPSCARRARKGSTMHIGGAQHDESAVRLRQVACCGGLQSAQDRAMSAGRTSPNGEQLDLKGLVCRSDQHPRGSLGFRHAELMTLMHYAGTADGTKCSKLPWVTFRWEATESKKLKPPPGQMLSFGFRGPGLQLT
eukprot:s5379_g4.t1